MLLTKKNIFLFSLLLTTLFSGCSYLKKEKPVKENSGEGYYSVKGFLDDQWRLLNNQPIVLLRVSKFNDRTDSAYVPLDSSLWKNIRKQFDPSDISDTRFLNQYKFSTFSDNDLNIIYFNYEALSKKLLTQKLNISADNLTHRILSVFIETRNENKTYEKTQKLTYIPHRFIQIQSFEKSIISRPEDLLVTYYFSYK
jgi:hypothetical protein